MIWSREQIDRLAPDEAALEAARKLADISQWQEAGSDERVVWGIHAGSAKEPYRTLAGMGEVAFHCTCPSRKRPCKHVLGLLLLMLDRDRGEIRPQWVNELLARREGRNRRKPPRKSAPRRDESSRAGKEPRRLAREARVEAGLQLVERWLRDLVGQGFSNVARAGGVEWEEIAARLVDAQAPGLARMVRLMSETPGSREDWPSVLLDQAAYLFLAVESYRRIDRLAPEAQADLRSFIGFTIRRDEVLQGVPVADQWVVLGTNRDREDRLQVRRTWLSGVSTGKTAVIIEYSMNEPGPDTTLIPGTMVSAELYYYPSAFPQRAVVGTRGREAVVRGGLPGSGSIGQSLDDFAHAIAANPWLDFFPMILRGVTPTPDRGRWRIVDERGESLPLVAPGEAVWPILALSGGFPIDLFGEWDGEVFYPLTVVSDRRWVRV